MRDRLRSRRIEISVAVRLSTTTDGPKLAWRKGASQTSLQASLSSGQANASIPLATPLERSPLFRGQTFCSEGRFKIAEAQRLPSPLPYTHHGSLGDGVLNLRKRDSHAQLGRHKGERVAGSLGRQRRRTAESGVHLETAGGMEGGGGGVAAVGSKCTLTPEKYSIFPPRTDQIDHHLDHVQ